MPRSPIVPDVRNSLTSHNHTCTHKITLRTHREEPAATTNTIRSLPFTSESRPTIMSSGLSPAIFGGSDAVHIVHCQFLSTWCICACASILIKAQLSLLLSIAIKFLMLVSRSQTHSSRGTRICINCLGILEPHPLIWILQMESYQLVVGALTHLCLDEYAVV